MVPESQIVLLMETLFSLLQALCQLSRFQSHVRQPQCSRDAAVAGVCVVLTLAGRENFKTAAQSDSVVDFYRLRMALYASQQ